jgi:hypothetical protein
MYDERLGSAGTSILTPSASVRELMSRVPTAHSALISGAEESDLGRARKTEKEKSLAKPRLIFRSRRLKLAALFDFSVSPVRLRDSGCVAQERAPEKTPPSLDAKYRGLWK